MFGTLVRIHATSLLNCQRGGGVVFTNRFDIRDSFKKHVASLQNMDKKLMKQEQDSYKIKDDVSRKLQTFSYEMNAKIGEAQKDIDEALLKIADST